MTTTDENLFDEANRPFLLLAQKYRAKLQQSDTESIFDIARRLRAQFEAKQAADAAKEPDAPDTDRFAGNRPGWRNGDEWAHDKRKKLQTQVRSDDPTTESEKALSDARATAYQDALTYAQEAWRIPGRIAEDSRRKKFEQRDPEGRESGTITENEEDDCNAEYKDWVGSQWKMGKP